MSDLVPDRKLPLSDSDGGSRLFSYLKKSSKSASGRAWRDMKSFVIRAEFALTDPVLSAPFFQIHRGFVGEGIHIWSLDDIREWFDTLVNALLYKLFEHGFAHVWCLSQ